MGFTCSATIRCAHSRYLSYVFLSMRKQTPLDMSRSTCWVMDWRWGSTPSSFVNVAMCWINTASLLYCSFEYPVSCRESFSRRFPLSPGWPENSVFDMGVCGAGLLFERDWRIRWEGARVRSVLLAICKPCPLFILVEYSSG